MSSDSPYTQSILNTRCEVYLPPFLQIMHDSACQIYKIIADIVKDGKIQAKALRGLTYLPDLVGPVRFCTELQAAHQIPKSFDNIPLIFCRCALLCSFA